MRDRFNILAMLNAGALHALLAACLLFAFDWGRTEMAVPLVIKGQVITDGDFSDPEPIPLDEPEPPEEEPRPEPETEPEPPPPQPEPDPAEQARIAAEEAKRQEDLRIEQEREAAEEAKRQEDLRRERERIEREEAEERQRQEAADAERKRREEEEIEKRRQEAERRRLEEIERQRVENERRREAAREAEEERRRQQEMQAEQNRLDAMNAGDLERYVFALRQKIERNWVKPASAGAGLSCTVSVRQLPGGEVVSVVVEQCNGDDSVRRSIEAAVRKASPLPEPANPALFERNLRFLFEPTQ